MYGLNWSGLVDEADPPPSGTARPWPTLRVEQQRGMAPRMTTSSAAEAYARLDVANLCRLDVHREPLRLVVTAPQDVAASLLLHPLGAFVGAVAARWAGRTALHGAAFVIGGRAVVALGSPASGKSTLAAAMAGRGHAVLADDLVVLDDSVVLAGPPMADLREDASAATGLGQRLGDSLGRERFRQTWVRRSLEAPLAGIVALAWGEEISVTRMPASDRLKTLAQNEALGLGPSRSDSFLHVLGTPFAHLTRPRDWRQLPTVASALEQWSANLSA